jgi:hypothetical protein
LSRWDESPSAPPEPSDVNAPLFHDEEGREFRTRWEGIQTGFVDEPRKAVEQADALVTEIMKRLSDVFAEERAALEKAMGTRGERLDRGPTDCVETLSLVL